ncbi:MAG: hypothetical protein Q6364_08895 [Candidatus Hermodarchaeota archaeon]|nr:hypothetical protein [Candidatus Hermodarchaeota archaeon]
MVFCSIARGPCQGRTNCRLWIRGRLLCTDSKLLAAQLARYVIDQPIARGNPRKLSSEQSEGFWRDKGIPNIHREILIDRYLRAKVDEVETIAAQWLESPGFHEAVLAKKLAKVKESAEPHTPHCKSPP